MARVLAADDDRRPLEMLRRRLVCEGVDVVTAGAIHLQKDRPLALLGARRARCTQRHPGARHLLSPLRRLAEPSQGFSASRLSSYTRI